MIQPLRRLHYRTFSALSVLLPVVLVSGLAVRRPVPQGNYRLPRVSISAEELPERLRAFKDVRVPDALLYWSPYVSPEKGLPPEARLLGPLHGAEIKTHPLPSDGYLILYSLAHQQIVATLGPEKTGDQP